ncbi:glycosyltransferase family 4 protein [Aquibacillus salsiterrae]|uniref:Glycosyltransferase family 4 protein n=1 Tax=Aquibacillus salsiterrae TaxID=2950439 RepID=A0A9X3WGG5_9BACI|nr:glycosyltransferase family 4 protein [Aquibacillus salsiterrae]MDC3417981.1 glycosyltransferase family 4 protein [Aquibacillus salsiterrae]
MNVLLVTPNFHQARGNTITVKRISDGLNNLGIHTEIISMTEETEYTSIPDADIVHGFHAYTFYQFLQQLDEKPKSYVITMTGTDLNHFLFNERTREDVLQCLKDADAVHVFNNEAKQIVLKEIPEVADKLFMLPQGLSTFKPVDTLFKKEVDTFLFILPAGIRKIKNVPFAISSLAKLHKENPRIRLWLVGPILEEDEGTKVQHLVDANSDWVTYLGQVPHEQMGALYSLADCILNTSISEGQSSAILEAMQYGLPVLVSDNEGNKDIVKNLETGFIYHSEDQFLDYANQIMNNIRLRQVICANAKNYITKQHLDVDEAHVLLTIYKQILT